MRIGLVCPYSLDVPGGVQSHVRGLAATLAGRGHDVGVLAPGEDTDGLPGYVETVGKAVAIPYNGSVARVAFGPRVAAQTRRWLREGRFDVLHVHEPATPSVSLLALRASEGPVVASFHTANDRSRALSSVAAILRPSMDKISARIAVSQAARDTLVHHLGGEPVVIPNGISYDEFARAEPADAWRLPGPVLVFFGRGDEPRKGLHVLLDAIPRVVAAFPATRVLIGGGTSDPTAGIDTSVRPRVTLLGTLPDRERSRLLASADVYVAPQTGGESFGIVLLEAMAAGAPVVASDLRAFRAVTQEGRLAELFPPGDAQALSAALCRVLSSRDRRDQLRRDASVAVRRYDWSRVGPDIEAVYASVTPQWSRQGHSP